MGLEAFRVQKDEVRITRNRTTREVEITFDGPLQDVVDFAVGLLVDDQPIDVVVDTAEKSAGLFQEWVYRKTKPPVLMMPRDEGPNR